MQDELAEQNSLYQRALKQKDEGEEKFNTAKEQMTRFGHLVEQKVTEAMKEERAQHGRMLEECEHLRLMNDRLEDDKRQHMEKLREQEKLLAELKGDRLETGNIGRQNILTVASGNLTSDMK